MSRNVCSIADCDDPVKGHGWCNKHYYRARRHGSPDITLRASTRSSETCSVEGCDGTYKGRGFCNKHFKRLRAHGDPLIVLPGGKPLNWAGDKVTYSGMHHRVRQARGNADQHGCVDCGAQAKEWSYNHSGEDERTSARGLPYGMDIEDYDPRCKLCHTNFDQARI